MEFMRRRRSPFLQAILFISFWVLNMICHQRFDLNILVLASYHNPLNKAKNLTVPRPHVRYCI